MTVHDRLKIVRDSLGKTQKDVAKDLGISPRTWQDYEGGISPPGGRALEQLAHMGFNVNWILTGEGEIKIGRAEKIVVEDKGFFERRLIEDTIKIIEEIFDEYDLYLPPEKKAKLILLFYDEFFEQKEKFLQPNKREELIKKAEGKIISIVKLAS